MSKIIDARRVLNEIVERISMGDIDEGEIVDLVQLAESLLYRRRSGSPRAPVKSKPLTAEIVEQAKRIKAAAPEMSIQEIANILKINPGRVSGALLGEYDNMEANR